MRDEEFEIAFSPERSESARRAQWASSFADHVSGADAPEAWALLFAEIEEVGLLLDQAERFQSFAKPLETLERHVLPAAIRLQDEGRLLRYGATAVTLRGLAEALFAAGVLPALMRGDGRRMAADLAAQLPSRAARAEAAASLAATCAAGSKEAADLQEQAVQELTRMLKPEDETSAGEWTTAVVGVARHLPARLGRSWSGWLADLRRWPAAQEAARRGIIEAWLSRGEAPDEAFWSLLLGSRDPELWLDFVPLRLAKLVEAAPLQARLATLPAGWEALAHRCLAALLGQAARNEPEDHALRIWRNAGSPAKTFATEACQELGRAFLALVDDEELAAFEGPLGPGAMARLWLTIAEETGSLKAADEARFRLEAVEEATIDLRAHLRLLKVYAEGHSAFPTGTLKDLAYRMESLGFQVPGEDLARYLDLVARIFPGRLPGALDAVLASPAGTEATLLELARRVRQEATLSELLRRAEILAAKVAEDGAQGFALRGELLTVLGCRLNEERAQQEVVEEVLGRLLPEEADDFLGALAATHYRIGRHELAVEASNRMASAHRRLASLLRYRAEPDPKDLAPSRLYRAVVDPSVWQDELGALAPLQELPTEPARIGREISAAVSSYPRRLLALADLAVHVLEFERRVLPPRRRDPLAALLPLKEALGVVESEPWLVAFTPELVALGSVLGPRQALAEHQEAIERLLELPSVPWRARREAIEALLARIPHPAPKGTPFSPGPAALAPWLHRFFRWLARRAAESGSGEASRETSLLLAATFGALPRGTRRAVHQRGRWWWTFLPQWFPGGRLRHRTDPDIADWPVFWPSPPLDPEVLPLLRAGPRDRLAAALGWLVSPVKASGEGEALAYLLAPQQPEIAAQLLAALDPCERRDALVARMIRHRWLDGASASGLPLPEDEVPRRHFQLWARLEEPEMLPELGALVRRGALDPWHPENIPVRRRLWELDGRQSSLSLASEAVAALHQAGREGGSRGLVWWLNAALAPELGCESSARKQKVLTFRAALEASKNLGPVEHNRASAAERSRRD